MTDGSLSRKMPGMHISISGICKPLDLVGIKKVSFDQLLEDNSFGSREKNERNQFQIWRSFLSHLSHATTLMYRSSLLPEKACN